MTNTPLGPCSACGKTLYQQKGSNRLTLSDGSSYCQGGAGRLTRHRLAEYGTPGHDGSPEGHGV